MKEDTFELTDLLDMPEVPWYERAIYAVKTLTLGNARKVKNAWQRATRGYDDTAWWSMDMYLADTIVKLVKELRMRGVGVPAVIYTELGFPTNEDGEYSKEAHILAKNSWNKILFEIEEGFKQYAYVDNCMLHPDAELKKFHHSFELLHRYFQNLWS